MPEQYPYWADSLDIWRDGPDRFVCQIQVDDDWYPEDNEYLVYGWGPTPHDALDDAIRRGDMMSISHSSAWEADEW